MKSYPDLANIKQIPSEEIEETETTENNENPGTQKEEFIFDSKRKNRLVEKNNESIKTFIGRFDWTTEVRSTRFVWPKEWGEISMIYYAGIYEDPIKKDGESRIIRLFPPKNVTTEVTPYIYEGPVYVTQDTKTGELRLTIKKLLEKIGYSEDNREITLQGDIISVEIYPYKTPIRVGSVENSPFGEKDLTVDQCVKMIAKFTQELLRLSSEKNNQK